ncbi:MAG: DUF192 domain-containing protein [Deltaproteobacteria bacterium]|nr:DUF192 domain-containing protein [Deltaproteobacteria bacterium]
MIFSLAAFLLLSTSSAENSFAGKPYVKIRGSAFQVEIVRTNSEWQKGLMFREHLGPREGMFFWGTSERPQSFWMKNTLISLDIIYISKDLKIVSVQKNAVPLSEESLPSFKPATHILEVPGGTADHLGFKAGDKIELFGFKPKSP